MNFTRGRGSAKYLKPGEYVAILNDQTWALYKCPECDLVVSLAKRHHDVHYDGEVKPYVTCPHKNCKFSQLVRLDNWVPEAKGSA